MSLFFQYTSSLIFDDAASTDSSTPKQWFRKVNSWLPRRKKDELQECQRREGNFFYSSLLYAFHLEMFWWIETNVNELVHHQRLIWPELDSVSLSSSLAWKLYWIEVKQRVIPPLVKYQATLLLLRFFQQFLSTLVTKETLLKLHQHPPRRARAIAERESDRILVGTEVFVASLWANLLFYTATVTVGQIGTLYNYYLRRRMARSRGSTRCSDKEDVVDLANNTWGVLTANIRRHFYSSLGAGLGSIVWPGWGTLLGTGLGDEWAKKQPEPQLPHQFASLIRSGMKNVFSVFHPTGWLNRFFPQASRNDPSDPVKPHDDLICGCCQTNEFSSDPTSRDRAPISSRACSHTICKSCVQQCHLAFMERTSNYEEWIKCPLCNTPRAFSSHDHLVNRSLCAAIAAIEKSLEGSGKRM